MSSLIKKESKAVKLQFIKTSHDFGFLDKIKYENLTELEIRKKADKLNWRKISEDSLVFNFEDKFFIDYSAELNWEELSDRKEITEEFIYKFADKIPVNNWGIQQRKLSEPLLEFLVEYHNFDIEKHIPHNFLSENFIRKYIHKIKNLDLVIRHCNVSLKFIRDYENKINWDILSLFYNNITSNFLEEFKEKINWEKLTSSFDISDDVIDKYKEYILRDRIKELKSNYALTIERLKNEKIKTI